MLQKSLRAQILALIGGSLLLTLLIALACIRLATTSTTSRRCSTARWPKCN